MRTARRKSLLERNADTDLWLHTLSRIPVLSGRLVYLSTLRNPLNGRYEHHGLSLHYGEDGADKAIRASHRKAFQEWLALGLAEKVDDLELYLESTGEDPLRVLRHWSQPEGWGLFLPAGVLTAEKSLFVSDLRSAAKILSQRYGAGGPGHSA